MTVSLRHLRSIALAAASCSYTAMGAHAAVVDFSGQPLGSNANPMQIAGASFFTAGGFNFVTQFSGGSLCPSISASSSANCSRTLEVSFAGGGASGIGFEFYANNVRDVGADIGDVDIYSGNGLLGTVDLRVTDDSGSTLDPVSLSGFVGVSRIVISSTDFGGLVYDNFRFDLGHAVPEPATAALLFAAAFGTLARRRRAAADWR